MTSSKKNICLLIFALFLSLRASLFAKSDGKLPKPVFFQLIDSTVSLELNDAVQFAHVNLPKKFHNTFLSYIKDSAATEIPGLKSPVYYNWQLANGKIINGDVYWTGTIGYIVIKIDDKRYVNSFSNDGIIQLKTLFKLQH